MEILHSVSKSVNKAIIGSTGATEGWKERSRSLGMENDHTVVVVSYKLSKFCFPNAPTVN